MAEDQGLPFRLDITLGLAVAVMTIWLVLSPPTTRFTVAIWLCVLFSLAVYPVLHLASWFSDQLHRKVYAISVVVWAGCVFILGWHIWPRPRSDLGPQIKPAAVVEIAGYDNLFNSGERQITSFVHAKNIGPGISRDVQGIVWIGAPVAEFDALKNQFIQDFLSSRMLASFRKQRARDPYGTGRSLAINQVQDFSGVSAPMSNDDYNKWKNNRSIVYLIAEITWTDDAGQWKTDLCEELSAPIKVQNRPYGIGVGGSCDSHNGIAERLPAHN